MVRRDDRPALDASRLHALAGVGRPWRVLDVVEETGSTNADLLARAAAGEDIGGAVLLAEHQTSGRGRYGRHWLTPPRSQLALSVGVDAQAVPVTGWGWLTLAAGVAVAEAVAELPGLGGGAVGLKWPNDVVVGDGKLAGILAEVAAPRQVIVVGLGLNVTMTADEAHELQNASPAWLDMFAGAPLDRTALADGVLRRLAARITAWRTAGGADDALVADYRSYSRTLGARVRASMPGDLKIEGVAAAIDGLGRLCIDTESGRQTVSAGDVKLLRPAG